MEAVRIALLLVAAALTMLLRGLREAAAALSLFSSASGLDGGAALILRATGISLIAEFAVHICEDAGEKALASRVELAVRVTLFAMAAPLLTEVVTIVTEALL